MECANCHDSLDPGSKRQPTFINDGGGHGGGKEEAFCPPCFAYLRAPKDPERLYPANIAALKCGSCGWTTVTLTGALRCGHCGGPHCLVVPPKPRTIDEPPVGVLTDGRKVKVVSKEK